MNYLATGENPPRLGNQHPNIVPYQVFPTSDGFIVLSIANDPTFKRFCENVGLGHLIGDPRFDTNAARVQNREAVSAAIAPVMKTKTTAQWVARLEELKVGCGPINTVREAFADPQIAARGAVVHMPHKATPDGVNVIANPVRLSETPADYRLPPPLLGEHTDEILSERLGFNKRKLGALRKKGVI
jgi:crotonobetainyl-CoA:carnitine CoA-transferase CaiB-like acyl-CoA transferase